MMTWVDRDSVDREEPTRIEFVFVRGLREWDFTRRVLEGQQSCTVALRRSMPPVSLTPTGIQQRKSK